MNDTMIMNILLLILELGIVLLCFVTYGFYKMAIEMLRMV